MQPREYSFYTPEEAQAFIEGVNAVNDPTFRVKMVVRDTSSKSPLVTFDLGEEKRELPRVLYTVLCEDDDE